MAGKGYTVGIASETKAFKQGIDSGVIKPLEDAEKALVDLGNSKGTDKLERGLEGAQKESKQLEKETKKTAEAIEQEYRQSYRKMKDSADDAYDKASDGAQDFKQEASQSARESAASFRGEFDDVGSLVQETLANAFVGFGPAGAAAGIAAAVGLGVVVEALKEQQDAADKLKEKLAGMYQAAVEEGRAYLDESQILKEMQDIMWNPDRVTEYNNLVKDSKDLGLDLTTVLAANAGDREKVVEVQTRINALLDEEKSKAQELGALELAQGQIASDNYDIDIVNAEKKYSTIAKGIDESIAKAKDALTIEQEYTKSQLDGIQRTRDASQSRWEAQAAAIDKAKSKIDEIPDVSKKTVVINVDDSAVKNWRAPMLPPMVQRFGRSIP